MPLAAVRGPTASHHAVGLRAAVRTLERLGAEAASRAGLDPAQRPIAQVALIAAAGADSAAEIRRLRGAVERSRIAADVEVRCDTDAALRAGFDLAPAGAGAAGAGPSRAADGAWGVVLVCGAGVNCLGVAPDGRVARLPALGTISGDRGGGLDVGLAGIAAAIRGRDRRGPRTILEATLPPLVGCRRPIEVALAVHAGRIEESSLARLAPAVFAAATGGDAVARGIVDGLADELATMAHAAMRRLTIVRSPVPVVLAGGVFRAEDAAFHVRLREGILAVAPRATITRLDAPPVVGAILLGLDVAATPVRQRADVAAIARTAVGLLARG